MTIKNDPRIQTNECYFIGDADLVEAQRSQMILPDKTVTDCVKVRKVTGNTDNPMVSQWPGEVVLGLSEVAAKRLLASLKRVLGDE